MADRKMQLRFVDGLVHILDTEQDKIVGKLLPELLDPELSKIVDVRELVGAQDLAGLTRWIELALDELGLAKKEPEGA